MNSMTKSACDRFDLAEAKLKSFTRSAVRTKVMLCLISGEKEVGELEEEICIRSSTILHSIKEMIEASLIKRTVEGYALTNIGKIQALLLNELVSTITVLDQHQDFWLNHDLSGIPQDLQMNIGMLSLSDVVAGDPIALLKAQEYFMEMVVESKEIKGVSPIIIPGYAEAMSIPARKGAEIDLILTRPILEIVLKEHRQEFSELMKLDNFRLYCLDKDIKVAFTVTDAHLYLGLYRLDGTYDLGNDLFCRGDSATNWGRKLFEYYLSMSNRQLQI